MLFYVSDTDTKNFPTDENDLNKRLEEIKKGFPQQRNNVKPFVKPALELIRDCGLITKENIEVLSRRYISWIDKNGLGRFIQRELAMNPLGGVLRREGLDMYDACGHRRYYYDGRDIVYIVCEGTKYYLSNHWFSKEKPRPTKDVFFYHWLEKKAWKSCKIFWQENNKNIQN